jgi:hypothetical protein
MRLFSCVLFLLAAALAPINSAQAAFHLMQIEQVIGGVNGDTTAQAIQLRMRSAGQHVVTNAKVEVADAAGTGHVLIERFLNNVDSPSAAGDRILIATAAFGNYTDIPLVADFIMDNPIPVSYLTNGRLTFRADSATLGAGTIYWSLAWDDPDAPAYTGLHTGASDNDDAPGATGNFGPAFPQALPTAGVQALQFINNETALSTSNNLDYALTAGAAVFTNNAGDNFTVTIPPSPTTPGDFNDDGIVDAADYVVWKKTEGTDFDLGGNGDETGGSANVVDMADYSLWVANFGEMAAGSGGGTPVPEPGLGVFAVVSMLMCCRRCARQPLLHRRGGV